MRPTYTAEQIRRAEQPLLESLPSGALMQRAATALAARCAALLGRTYGARVVLLVGAGNNGGDTMLAGARLAGRGARVDALIVADEVLDNARAELARSGGRMLAAGAERDAALIDEADLVIDGMVGIGGSGGLRPPAARLAGLVAAARRRGSGPFVVAVDVPSGVDASTGEVAGVAVEADLTVTFGGLKPGLLVAPGAAHTGAVDVVDLGLALPAPEIAALDTDDVAALRPRPVPDSDKYSRGVVGVVAGSNRYTGAAVLCVGGAVLAGAGMVRYAGVAEPAHLVRARWPEAIVTVITPVVGDSGAGDDVVGAGRVQCWVVGSGLGTDDEAEQVVTAVLGTDVPVVVDAGGLSVLASRPGLLAGRSAPTLLTPHAGEFARLVGAERADVEARRLHHVRQAAERLGVTVLLKGSTTLIADPAGAVRVNTAQSPYLATAGSGDVLAGVCGTMLAAGLGALDAAAIAAFVHGLAGVLAADQPPGPVTAMQVAASLPAALRAVDSPR